MKSIITMLRIDMKLVVRDKIVLYMVLAPALLTIVYLLVIGGVGKASIEFAVASNVPANVTKELKKVGNVKVYNSDEDIKARVDRMDSAAGVMMKNDRPFLLLEGNEPEGFEFQVSFLLARAIAADIPDFENYIITSGKSLIKEISMVTLLLLCFLVGSAAAGFSIVAERESHAIRALRISPLSINIYLAERTLLAVLISAVSIAMCAALMKKGIQIPYMFLIALASAPVCALMALILGATASNQISSISTIKLMMPIALGVPIISIFVPQGLRFLFWWIPMYWQYNAMASALTGKLDVLALILLFLTGTIWFFATKKWAEPKLR